MATVMLHGGSNPTLPRDTVFAVLMIVLNSMVGVSVITGALRHRQQQYNLLGAIAFLAVITCLAVQSLVVRTFATSTREPTLTLLQAVVFGTLTALLYVGFLGIQTMRHRTFFVEAEEARSEEHHAPGPKNSVYYHAVLLIVTLLPVVLSAIQAAQQNHMQCAVNLSLGSALSTIGLTIPTMLAISLLTGTPLEFGLPAVETVLLVLTLFIAHMTFSGAPTNILLGGVHLVLFIAFIVLVFNP